MSTEWFCIDVKKRFLWFVLFNRSVTITDRKVNKPRHSIKNGPRKETLLFNRFGVNIQKLE
jgi:hypothetical protein